MATRLFPDDQMEQLKSYPDIGTDELIRFFTLTPADAAFVMSSPDLLHWETPSLLVGPRHDWELVQMGNCGSPIETDAGWLVITHGVGLLRRYVLGALLLDGDDPSVVVGRLARPLLEPDDEEREGYVPNVLYSCGALVHAGRLVLPYAYADRACSAVSFDLDELIAALR